MPSGFDRWLGQQLHDLYDPVLAEGVPESIAQLIEGFAEREPEADKKTENE